MCNYPFGGFGARSISVNELRQLEFRCSSPRDKTRTGSATSKVVEHDGRLHLFHLTPPNHHQVGHLVSSEGLHWDPLPPAIRTGDPGEFDVDQIWTMGVRRLGSTWFMLYTALPEDGLRQVTGLAASKDL